ncbi:fungal specific transcription factor domain-containing protein [Sclerotinia borealis F-4128]|uniref:Fungal specific transcription factor domain-containing protein n=1 Tax=Sclerotinia borealis (strain F-4128) TaxID=1432307 RepID=W9CT86_SCLBF|nr:fungal specific transcription factor domain-containing protein [Sclerotinia borealis F-4128]
MNRGARTLKDPSPSTFARIIIGTLDIAVTEQAKIGKQPRLRYLLRVPKDLAVQDSAPLDRRMADVRDAENVYGDGGSSSLTDVKINPDHESNVMIDRDSPVPRKKSRSGRDAAAKTRRCVSTACVACRKRKSKCDGNIPSCAACSSVYGTECVYDPLSDHRRKGVYKEKIDSLKTRSSTLQTLIQAILNAAEDDVPNLVRQIRTCESLDDVADNILNQAQGLEDDDMEDNMAYTKTNLPTFETQLSGKMGELRLENGSVRFLGGTSNLIYLPPTDVDDGDALETTQQQDEPLLSWTTVTQDTEVIVHLINMYFTWHYPYFTTLSKTLFYQDFLLGKPPGNPKRTMYCSSLLVSTIYAPIPIMFSLFQVNAMLALGCHFTNSPKACADPTDPTTKGDAFFAEAKRLIVENDEYEKPKLTTIQALCLMSVREAGAGREGKGWVYSGMAFRMAQDMGLNLDSGINKNNSDNPKDCLIDEKEIDVRLVTFWGCFLFDKCWSNYLGRLPQLPVSNITVPKYDVFLDEDSSIWSPYTDNGIGQLHSQPSRTRAVALQISSLCEISSDLLTFFYHPQHVERGVGRSQELKKLSELQTRLEAWRRDLPKEFEPKEGQLPNVLLMHMFFHLLYIHLFRPFLKYNPSTSPLPTHVSPRKLCTQAAGSISKLMRLYKRIYGLRQICNIAVYIVHSACTIHLLSLPEKTSKRDIIHGVKHLEEIAEDWLCARRTLSILSVLARKWNIDLPPEASAVFSRTDSRFGTFSTADLPSPKAELIVTTPSSTSSPINFQAVPHSQPLIRGQSQLQQSLYSYPIDTKSPLTNSLMHDMSPQSSLNGPQPDHSDPITYPINASGITTSNPLHMSPVSAYPMYANPAQSFSPSITNAPNTSSNSPLVSVNRQVSPSTLFGGVEQLVQSQDWWLRDQANLVMGFGNWIGGGYNVGGHGHGHSHSHSLSGDLGAGSGDPFYHNSNSNPNAGNGNDNGNEGAGGTNSGFGDDGWFS